MMASRASSSRRGWPRLIALALLLAWSVGDVWCFAYVYAARHVLRGRVHQRVDGFGMPLDRGNMRWGMVTAWAISLRLSEALAIVLLGLAIWAVVLLLARRPHPRQWATILVFAVVALLGWVFFSAAGASASAVSAWISPAEVRAAQWGIAAGVVVLAVLAYAAIRHAPEPVDPQYDRYSLVAYTPFNKARPGGEGDALAEARARAESVLPVDDDTGPGRSARDE